MMANHLRIRSPGRVAVAISFLALLVLSRAHDVEAAPPASRSHPAGSARQFVLPAAKGGTVSLDAFKGRPVLVNFWASWCPGCRAEMPELEALSRDRPGCLAVVGIAEDSGGPQEILAFARPRSITYPLLLDDGSAAMEYGVQGIPYSVLIDAQGNVVRRFLGEITRETVRSAVQRLEPSQRCRRHGSP